ncbi:M48 family metallopeptidase [Stakelama sp. CBK3Z-3]|uniref:M48 family metallopeptidase n=2 Tax=Stakelama flava TaxID=2860338 RepID=A0ABS6XLE3_9SPHN|nr:SprT family zinc-dependent metalloprotease [Stakelama flava]MBW4330739.1 M48 family metallopeptidase [Stakelama flava]
MRLSVDPASGRVRLTIPRRASERAALRWAQEHHEWVAARRAELPRARPFDPGERVPVHGEQFLLLWDETAPRRVQRVGETLACGGPREGFSGRVERWLRAEAKRILEAETHVLANANGIHVERVSIGDPRSRWGSCSSSGAIRYSWRLILAPRFVLRSTVAHEVAHRRHMNHGPDFHALERELLGDDPGEARRWLRANGAGLHWFGRSVSDGAG